MRSIWVVSLASRNRLRAFRRNLALMAGPSGQPPIEGQGFFKCSAIDSVPQWSRQGYVATLGRRSYRRVLSRRVPEEAVFIGAEVAEKWPQWLSLRRLGACEAAGGRFYLLPDSSLVVQLFQPLIATSNCSHRLSIEGRAFGLPPSLAIQIAKPATAENQRCRATQDWFPLGTTETVFFSHRRNSFGSVSDHRRSCRVDP